MTPPPNVPVLRPLPASAGVAMGTVENVLLVAWVGPTTLATMEALRKASQDLARRYPAGVGHFNVVPSVPAGPAGITPEVRDELVRILRDTTLVLRTSVVVYPGGGFVAAMMRSLLAGATLLARSSTAIRFFETPPQAEEFLRHSLQQQKAPVPTKGAVLRGLEELRGRLSPEDARRL